MDGNIALVESLLQAGADINFHGLQDEGKPIHYAIWKNHMNMALRLIEMGANIHVEDSFGFTPFHDAILYSLDDIVAAMIKAGADVNAPNPFGETPLHMAAEGGSMGIVQMLLSAGAKSVRNRKDQYPINMTKDPAILDVLRAAM
jgi:ankyrin repeat protein